MSAAILCCFIHRFWTKNDEAQSQLVSGSYEPDFARYRYQAALGRCRAEIRDARIPAASGNPELVRICAGKPLLTVLSKADLADPEITVAWQAHFRNMTSSGMTPGGLRRSIVGARDDKRVLELAAELAEPILEREQRQGRLRRPVAFWWSVCPIAANRPSLIRYPDAGRREPKTVPG